MTRPASHELYDSACELLLAAQHATAAAAQPGTGEAVPATLACLGAAFDELTVALRALTGEVGRTEALDRLLADLSATARDCEAARAAVAARAAALH